MNAKFSVRKVGLPAKWHLSGPTDYAEFPQDIVFDDHSTALREAIKLAGSGYGHTG